MKNHHYKVNISWTGNQGSGTSNYKAYKRDHEISVDQKQVIFASSDPTFSGDKTRYNPEELLVASLSSCHMLWYLHLCSTEGVVVIDYEDNAEGTMEETANGGGRFTLVTLHPVVTVAEDSMIETADKLHMKANKLCFIANSCNFPVHHQATYKVAIVDPQ